jgi:hypothetical protein
MSAATSQTGKSKMALNSKLRGNDRLIMIQSSLRLQCLHIVQRNADDTLVVAIILPHGFVAGQVP